MLAMVKLILQVVLFGIFLYMYGEPAIAKLAKQSTIVIKERAHTNGIGAPSITISARGRDSLLGWKKKSAAITRAKTNDMIVHQCRNFSSVEECLNSETFNRSDVIKDTLVGFERRLSLMNKDKIWSSDFTYVRSGRSYTVHPEMLIGPLDDRDQIIVLLDNNYAYDIFVHEKNFFMLNDNRCTFPSVNFKIVPKASDNYRFYHKISATQHMELNVPEDPCVEDTQYSFAACVKENLAKKIGCRPSWDVWSDQKRNVCTKIEQHRCLKFTLINPPQGIRADIF